MKMFTLTFILFTLMVAPSISLAGNQAEEGKKSAWFEEVKGWSMEDHLAAAKQHETEAQEIESRIQNLENRISNLSNKPYFDPKGFGRSNSKSLLATLERELADLQERIAWHYQQTNHAKNHDVGVPFN
ncbi:MAG: hypothetical protein AB7P17_12800 [Nitrospirales bacterium]|nr:hypothetical protein [Nitrospirales bacterium]